MLQSLKIDNYALINDLKMSPSGGFNIITGETGAGKSIMLGALGLLVGNRADTKVLLDSERKCIVEGVFNIKGYQLEEVFDQNDLDYDQECIIRREINPVGKSRAFVNDTPVTLDILKTLGGKLIDVHSQHETILLGSEGFQIKVLDAFSESLPILATYQEHYREYKRVEADLNNLKRRASDSQKDLDYKAHLLNELVETKLISGEQEQAEERLKILENTEKLREKLSFAIHLMTQSEWNVKNALSDIVGQLSGLVSISEKYEKLYERLNSINIDLDDISYEIEHELIDIEDNPEERTELQQRLDLIYRLQQKHQVTSVEALLTVQNQLDEEVGDTTDLEGKIDRLQKELVQREEELRVSGKKLSDNRKSFSGKLEQQIMSLLHDLGMPDCKFEVNVDPSEPTSRGMDDVTFLFSANKGVKPEELKKVASGGEFSRLMLAIKYVMASKTALPTLVLDEIDTGVSGEIAIKMANMMKSMSQHHQVISISHLPQIAAKGDTHYYVYKDSTSDKSISKIKKLENEDRKLEIAKMIGGDTPSESAIKSAEELLVS